MQMLKKMPTDLLGFRLDGSSEIGGVRRGHAASFREKTRPAFPGKPGTSKVDSEFAVV